MERSVPESAIVIIVIQSFLRFMTQKLPVKDRGNLSKRHKSNKTSIITGHLRVPSSLYYPTKHYPPALYLFVSKALKIDSISYFPTPFLYPPIRIIILLLSLHFPPFLPTFIYPPLLLWKMWKNLWKTYQNTQLYSNIV